ncbi:MAG: iron-containing alcohol dehydrogenase, partial [Butyrivibrio sp.]|nr:iron-containing alcohol dehydrogenase [Butyrivibrio sp.]
STRFAVVYKDHVKQSLDAPELLPDVVILDPDVLACLPAYPRTCAAFDAMCQAIESWWSPRATEESRSYAKEAIRLMMPVFKRYLDGSSDTFPTMIKAANLAGRAIDITRTTAPHAMSYALTMRCGIAHGHAVTLLLPYVWEYMAERVNTQKETGLAGTFSEIADALFACGVSEAVERLKELNDRYGMCAPQGVRHVDFGNLTASVIEARLNNNPVPLTPEVIANIYRKALTCGTSVSSYQPVTGPGGSRRTI